MKCSCTKGRRIMGANAFLNNCAITVMEVLQTIAVRLNGTFLTCKSFTCVVIILSEINSSQALVVKNVTQAK